MRMLVHCNAEPRVAQSCRICRAPFRNRPSACSMLMARESCKGPSWNRTGTAEACPKVLQVCKRPKRPKLPCCVRRCQDWLTEWTETLATSCNNYLTSICRQGILKSFAALATWVAAGRTVECQTCQERIGRMNGFIWLQWSLGSSRVSYFA